MCRSLMIAGVCTMACLVYVGCCGPGTPAVVWRPELDRDALGDQLRELSGSPDGEQTMTEVDRALEGAEARAIEVLSARIREFGVRGAKVYADGNGGIAIELPGIDAAGQAELRRLLPRPGFLELRMVHKDNDALVGELLDKDLAPDGYAIIETAGRRLYRHESGGRSLPSTPERRARMGRLGVPDPSYELLLEEREEDGQVLFLPLFVHRRRVLTGQHIKDARVGDSRNGRTAVRLTLDAKGARRFAQVTADYAPGGERNPDPSSYRRVAMVLDGRLFCAPVIREAIYGGKMELVGVLDAAEAAAVALLLRCGALPAPVRWVDDAAGEAAERGSVVGHLRTRDKTITLRAGPDGPLYTVESQDGQILATDLPADKLSARFPDLSGLVERGVAEHAGIDPRYQGVPGPFGSEHVPTSRSSALRLMPEP